MAKASMVRAAPRGVEDKPKRTRDRNTIAPPASPYGDDWSRCKLCSGTLRVVDGQFGRWLVAFKANGLTRQYTALGMVHPECAPQ